MYIVIMHNKVFILLLNFSNYNINTFSNYLINTTNVFSNNNNNVFSDNVSKALLFLSKAKTKS